MWNKFLLICNKYIVSRAKYFLFGICLFYALTALKSSGFHQADEHFQIIEFANYKMGKAKSSDLAWEFDAGIRSTIQPALCYLIFRCLEFLNIHDPYVMAFVLRLISAFLAVFSITVFIKSQKEKIGSTYLGLFVLLSYLLWFIPYISVRFSSETWSGIFILLSIPLIERIRFNPLYLLKIGILLGTAILFRYQSALLVAGLFFWLLIIYKIRFKYLTWISTGILLMLILGFLIDVWFYQKAIFTLYNYFYVNIIEDVASNFGTAPWYQYFLYILKGPSLLIGVFILVSIGCLIIYYKNDMVLWILFPFVLVHSIIPHKELRFFFSIAFFAPYILILCIRKFDQLKLTKYKWVFAMYFFLFFFTNAFGLMAVSTKGAGNGKNALGEYVYGRYYGQKINVIYTSGLNSYIDWPFVSNTFYRNDDIHLKRIETIWQHNFKEYIDPEAVNLVMFSNNEFTGPRTIEKMDELGFQLVFESIPKIGQFIISVYQPDNNDNLQLYELQSKR